LLVAATERAHFLQQAGNTNIELLYVLLAEGANSRSLQHTCAANLAQIGRYNVLLHEATPLILPSPTPIPLPTEGKFRLSPTIAQRAAEGKPLVIRLSYHDISNEFAPFIRRGVVRSVEDFKANVELIGPVGPDANVQIAELERLLEVGVDGLAISPVNSEALAPIIDRYLEQGIPVVTFNTDQRGLAAPFGLMWICP
jgi:hypothetical protein